MSSFARSKTTDKPGHYDYRTGFVTTGSTRYDANTRYHRRVTTGNPKWGSMAAHGSWGGPTPNAFALVKSAAYDQFIEQCKGESASLGAAIGEWESSFDMIAARAIQLRKGITAFRRGQLSRAAAILAVPKDSVRNARGGVNKRHYASSLWLETHFGWTPMIGDIYNAVDVIQRPFPKARDVKGRSTTRLTTKYSGIYSGTATTKLRGMYYGKVEVTNPNLLLANQLGLVNPLSVAWELVPFSFVVDWFVNVSQILSSVTDLLGLKVTRAGYTWSYESDILLTMYPDDKTYRTTSQMKTKAMLREPGGVSRPPLALQSPLGGLSRATTQISLLIKLFT